MTKKEAYQEKRKKLKVLSKMARTLIKENDYKTVNEAIIEGIYKEENPEITEFNTFNQWSKKGMIIKKGSIAFMVWGQPRNSEQEETEENDEYTFWPVCYLFSNLQVFDKEGGSK